LEDLVSEVRQRLARKAELDNMTRQAEGLRVVHGIRDEDVKVTAANAGDDTRAVDASPVAATATETLAVEGNQSKGQTADSTS
jgi:histidyl-tRNA synthetase